jgi:hypothetical protein
MNLITLVKDLYDKNLKTPEDEKPCHVHGLTEI